MILSCYNLNSKEIETKLLKILFLTLISAKNGDKKWRLNGEKVRVVVYKEFKKWGSATDNLLKELEQQKATIRELKKRNEVLELLVEKNELKMKYEGKQIFYCFKYLCTNAFVIF